MSLDHTDLQLIERLMYKNGDDVAVSIARSFERLEERISSLESRVYARFAESDDKLYTIREEIVDSIDSIKQEFRDSVRYKNRELVESF